MDTKTPHQLTLVAAVDASDQATVVIQHAVECAAGYAAAAIHVVRVIPRRQQDDAAIDDTLRQLQGVTAEVLDAFVQSAEVLQRWRVYTHVRAGRPDEEIVGLAHETTANLIVIGHHGEGGRRPLFAGTTPERVLRQAPCNVLVTQTPIYDHARVAQCAACVEVRAHSDGERWFCGEHLSQRPLHATRVSTGASLLQGYGSTGMY